MNTKRLTKQKIKNRKTADQKKNMMKMCLIGILLFALILGSRWNILCGNETKNSIIMKFNFGVWSPAPNDSFLYI